VTILWSPIQYTPLSHNLVRQYLDYTVVGWWDLTVLASGQYLHLREHPFGGYEFHLRYKDWFWSNRAGSGTFLDVIDDLYVTSPGSSTPISAGPVIFEVKYDSRRKCNVIVLANTPNDGHYLFNRFPRVPSDYWYQPPPLPVSDVFLDFVP